MKITLRRLFAALIITALAAGPGFCQLSIPKSWYNSTDSTLAVGRNVASQSMIKSYISTYGFSVLPEAADTTMWPVFSGANTGAANPKTHAGWTFNASTGMLTGTGFTGPVTGTASGNPSTASLAALSTGLLKSTTGTGALSIGAPNTDYSVPISAAPANQTPSGTHITETAGEIMAIGSVCYMGPDGKMWKAKGVLPDAWVADTVYEIGSLVKSTTYVGGTGAAFYFCSANAGDKKSHAATEPDWASTTTIGATVVDDQVTWTCVDYNSIGAYAIAGEVISADAAGSFMLVGYLRDDSWSAMVLGQPIYLSASTAGAFTQIRPVTAGDLPQRLGRCASVNTKTILFDPKVMSEAR